MNNFCINCGAKIEKDYNYCINCGTKIDKSYGKQNDSSLKSATGNAEKAGIPKENKIKIENNEMTHGGYCSFNCRHYHEEFLDSYGGIVGDFDGAGYVEYYCNLGHSIVHGRFCKDYE